MARRIWPLAVGLFFASSTLVYLDISIGHLESAKKSCMVLPHGGWPVHRDLFSTFGRFIGESVKKTIIFVAYPLVRSRLAQRGLSDTRSTARRRVDTPERRPASLASVSTRLQRDGSTCGRGVSGGQNRARVGPTGTPRGVSTRARGGSRDQVRAKLASSSVIWVPCGRHLGVI